jgi:anti-anti-sigma regulatory factor
MSGDWQVVKAPVEMDGRDAVEMVSDAMRLESDVIVDLRATRLLTSMGCSALMELHQALTSDGRRVALSVDGSDIVRSVLRITGLDQHLDVVSDGHEGRGGDLGG